MRLRVVLTVSTVMCVVWPRPMPVSRVHRDATTLQGVVRGYFTPDPPHFAYFGVPYARSPTRRDRFKAPNVPPKWDGVFEAIHKVKCPQQNADGEENCLVVNVFAPEHATSLPVLVFVHEGDFQNGWGAYQPPTAFLNMGFVIVTFNYRIGALGFLCLRTPEAPGNAGLKDQIAALYWVHMNIAQFGGSPRDVTVYGTGSGAAAVQLVLLSEMVQGLIHRVVLESGSALSPSAMTYDPQTIAYKGASSLSYEGTDNPDELYKFYQYASAEDLSSISEMFLPCVDNSSDYVHSLIESDPKQKLEEGKFLHVPMLVTFTQKDKTSIIGTGTERLEHAPASFVNLMPNNLEFDNYEVKQKVSGIVKEFYFSEDFLKANIPQSYADYIHDILTEYPIVKMAMLFAAKNSNPVYVMKFTLPKESGIPVESSGSFDSLLDYLYKNDERTGDVTDKMMLLLKNFMTLSDPTPLITTLVPLIWQPLPYEEHHLHITDIPVLHFGATMRMGVPPNSQRLHFWDNIYNKFYKTHQYSKQLNDND